MSLRYLGSLRGQEGAACAARGIAFTGFPAEPLYRLTSLRGVLALIRLQQARGQARRDLAHDQPDVVFSTGGYSAGPVVAAARDLRIPYIVHSADSAPPRSSAMFAKEAFAFTTVFRSTETHYTSREVTRTGQPIRRELRDAAASQRESRSSLVLVLGGSQGSEFLNQTIPQVALAGRIPGPVLHVSGPKHLEKTRARITGDMAKPYDVVPFLETPELIDALRRAAVVVARAGGTLAELAAFGIPAVLIPLPSSANDHQLYNAREFAEIDAATVLWQPEDRRRMAPPATIEAIGDAVALWVADGSKRAAARHNLRQWDIPDATERIVDLIEAAAGTGTDTSRQLARTPLGFDGDIGPDSREGPDARDHPFASGRSPFGAPTPKGLQFLAKGCREAATLDEGATQFTNPEGVPGAVQTRKTFGPGWAGLKAAATERGY
jgi:UDP-N-acetylglucosamine--N-acetylmuramyl-(pentapeptide) pyrophosphoryl-undecaprenol N-acetylglucosamine transferase